MRSLQRGVRCVLMRGGTSKGVFIHQRDLPQQPAIRDAVLLRLFGSPDVRQIDGLGGADVLTSKLAIISPSKRADIDVEYTFGQISTTSAFIDWGGNCGNISSGVGPFAIDEGLVPASTDGVKEIRIHQTNTDATLVSRVRVKHGRACVAGDCQINGVPGYSSPIELDFSQTAGASTGHLLPTGNTTDMLSTAQGLIEVSLVDAGILTVFVRAEDIGITCMETPAELERPELLMRMEEIRGAACAHLGLVKKASDASTVTPYAPFIAAVAAPKVYTNFTTGDPVKDAHFLSRLYFMQRLHKAYPVTGTIATGAAACIPGTLVHSVCTASDGLLRIGHPAGIIDVDIQVQSCDSSHSLQRAVMLRTARRIMDGTAYIEPDVWPAE